MKRIVCVLLLLVHVNIGATSVAPVADRRNAVQMGEYTRSSVEQKPEESSPFWVVIVLAGIVCVACFPFLRRSIIDKSSGKSGGREADFQEKDTSKLDEEIQVQIAQVHKKYWPEYLAFAVTEQAFSLHPDIKEKLAVKYGQNFSEPVIKWTEEFKFVPVQKFLRVNEEAGKYLKKHSLNASVSGDFYNVFEESLLEKAKMQAEEIIEEAKNSL